MRNRQNNGEISEGAPARRRRTRRVLAAFLAGSAALHAAALVVLPGISFDREPAQVRVLEVVLVQSEPLVAPAEPAPAPPPPQRSRAPERKLAGALAMPESPRRADVPPPVLALPDPRPVADTAPAASRPAETRAASVETRTEAASIAPTPPSFSAAYLRNPAPRYPVAARYAGEQGTVILRVLVTREGLPARVDLEKSSGSTHLDNAALEAVKGWRFTPARQGAEPVESWVLVPIVFRLEGSS